MGKINFFLQFSELLIIFFQISFKTNNMADSVKVEHNLALKVMRLTRPTFGAEMTSPLMDSLSSDGALEKSLHQALGSSINLGQALVLPQSFGSIYLGETFMSYVSLHNNSTETCDSVILKCDLQTATQRLPLLQPPQPQGVQVQSGGSIDHVLSHEVKELGTHILVCEVVYSSPGKSKLNFRKFFKFNVMKPLDVKTKFYNAESEDVFLEAQVQNVTAGPLCLEKVGLDPSPMFKVTSLNQVIDQAGNAQAEKHVFGRYNYLQPQDSRQYLFCLTPKNELKSNYKQLRGATNIGKMDIIWRTNMGDRGRLQTSQLQRMTPNHGDVRFNVESIPSIVRVNEAFKLTCTIMNNSDRTLDLELSLESVNKPKTLWTGSTSRKLGLIEPSGSPEIVLECVPQDTALQIISGVKLTDTSLKRTYDFDNICHVYVKPKLDPDGSDLKLIHATG